MAGLFVTGNELNNAIVGSSCGDDIVGLNGRDTLFGDDGNTAWRATWTPACSAVAG